MDHLTWLTALNDLEGSLPMPEEPALPGAGLPAGRDASSAPQDTAAAARELQQRQAFLGSAVRLRQEESRLQQAAAELSAAIYQADRSALPAAGARFAADRELPQGYAAQRRRNTPLPGKTAGAAWEPLLPREKAGLSLEEISRFFERDARRFF